MTRRIGLLGGTFDPPHVGHLVAARDVLEALELDEVRLVVAQHPPHKQERETAPAEFRARMVEACLLESEGDAAGLVVDRVELERPGPSWTVDTLRTLRDREPDTEWFLILGADQMAAFGTWREPEEIARMATLVVMARAGLDPGGVDGTDVGGDCVTVDVTRIDVSSTDVRRRFAEGRSVRWLVPAAALRIMEEEGLYAAPDGPGEAEEER